MEESGPETPPRALPDASTNPTTEMVLRWIAASAPTPWFPSAFAVAAGVPRDSLDEPLAELRLAGLTRIAAWVRGQGQGYSLTPAGETCAKDASILAKLGAGPPALPPPELETLTAATSTVSWPRPLETPKPAAPEPPIQLDLRPPTITPALLIANLAWFVVGAVVAWRWNISFSRFLADGGHSVLLMRMGAVNGQTLLEGEWWRLITCCFVHIGLIHLLANTCALGMTGSLAEVLWGRWRLALIYLLSGLAGSCLAMGLHPMTESGAPVLLAGASGAIWGLMTSLLAWLLLYRDVLQPALVSDWSRRLGLMFMLNIGVSFIPGVSWEGHLGGGLAGFFSAGLVNALRSGDRARRIAAMLLLILFPIGCIGGLYFAMRTSDSWSRLRTVDLRQRYEKQIRQPMLEALRPANVEPLDREVTFFVVGGGPKRDPASRDAYREQIDSLLRKCDGSLAKLGDASTTDLKLGRLLAQSQSFVEAQRDYLQQLKRILDSPTVPDAVAWNSLREKRDLVDQKAAPLFVYHPRAPVRFERR